VRSIVKPLKGFTVPVYGQKVRLHALPNVWLTGRLLPKIFRNKGKMRSDVAPVGQSWKSARKNLGFARRMTNFRKSD
jgi:hypothetical protein